MSTDDADEKMAPDASPGEKNKSGVRRVNNMPMYLLGGVVLLFVVMMMVVASDRASKQNKPAEDAAIKTAGNSTMLANEVVGQHETGMIAPTTPPIEMPEIASATISVVVPNEKDLPPTQPGADQLKKTGGTSEHLDSPSSGFSKEDLNHLQMARMQMLEEAIKAKTAVQGFRVGGTGGAGESSFGGGYNTSDDPASQLAAVRQQLGNVSSTDPNAGIQDRLNQLKSIISSVAGGSASGAPSLFAGAQAQTTGSSGYSQFEGARHEGSDRWKLNTKMEAPRSPYVLRAGYVIPGLLISGINSDLPGQIMAQVSENVYDTATGHHVLIPQGARLVGSYSSEVAFGQSRVLVAWQRINFPDGKAMDIGGMPGADSAGYAGFKDRLNTHFWKVFSSSFLMSGIVAGINLSQDSDGDATGNSQRAGDAMSEALGQQLGQTMTQMIMKNLNIAPTIEIRPGYRFNTVVNKDLTFQKPYQSFDY